MEGQKGQQEKRTEGQTDRQKGRRIQCGQAEGRRQTAEGRRKKKGSEQDPQWQGLKSEDRRGAWRVPSIQHELPVDPVEEVMVHDIPRSVLERAETLRRVDLH
jgi:hypothetical protein